MKFEIINFETNAVETITAKDVEQAAKLFRKQYSDKANWFLTKCIAGHWQQSISRHYKLWFGLD